MPKQSPKDFRNFYIKDIPQKTFCPLCHRAIRYAVPGETLTYLVHALDDICVMENDQEVKNG